jgi:hypothetical protein
VSSLGRRRGRRSIKRILDDAVEAAEQRITTIGPPLREELYECFRYEDELVFYSPSMVDLPEKVYKKMGAVLRRRGLKIKKQKEVELRGDRLVSVNRYLIEGDGVGEEATLYARLNHLRIVKVV